MEFSRPITHRYVGALEQVWLTCAQRIGLKVERTDAAYATSDGRGTLGLAHQGELDPDDNLAQMIFHELCHSLVEGSDSFAVADWGLDNETDEDAWREHGCLRAQAVLAAGYGLREFFAPTTDFRSFYDALAADPLSPPGDPSVVLAMRALQRADKYPWSPHLRGALAATAAIVGAVNDYTQPVSATPDGSVPVLYGSAPPAPTLHPVGFPAALDAAAGHTCGACAWMYLEESATGAPRCRQADGTHTDADAPACERWEPEADCLTCGACCREAYHSVTVDEDDPVVELHPALIVQRETYKEIKRTDERCSQLSGGPPGKQNYTCAIYDERPRCCRELERGGEHCLTARRRVGLSR